jgi:8-oxo-dGTP diphosphatase
LRKTEARGPEGAPTAPTADDAEAPGGGAGSKAAPLVVVAALVERSGEGGRRELFLARRALGIRDAGLWELPGGKVEPGEEPGAALVREIREELETGIELLGGAERYDSVLRGRDARFMVFPARFKGDPRLGEAHDAASFFPPDAALGLDLAPLDGSAVASWATSGTRQGPGRRPRCGA